MAKKIEEEQRKYWVTPEETFSEKMGIREFLSKAGCIITNGCEISIFQRNYQIGRVMANDSICVDYDSKRIEDINYLNNVMDFIELLSINNIPFKEGVSRDIIKKNLKQKLTGLIKKLKETPSV